MYHREANPPRSSQNDDTFELWTRHNFATLQHHLSNSADKALPFFHYSDSEGAQQLFEFYHSSFYRYLGQYRIDSVEKFPGGSLEVREFIEARDESKKERTASKWKEMLSSDWIKVVVRRCPEDRQTGDPVKAAAASASIASPTSHSSGPAAVRQPLFQRTLDTGAPSSTVIRTPRDPPASGFGSGWQSSWWKTGDVGEDQK